MLVNIMHYRLGDIKIVNLGGESKGSVCSSQFSARRRALLREPIADSRKLTIGGLVWCASPLQGGPASWRREASGEQGGVGWLVGVSMGVVGGRSCRESVGAECWAPSVWGAGGPSPPAQLRASPLLRLSPLKGGRDRKPKVDSCELSVCSSQFSARRRALLR